MIRVLVLIMITGFVVGVASLSAAFALGGPELAARGWNWTVNDWWDRHDRWDRDWRDRDWHDRDWHDRDRSERHRGPSATREFAWDGATALVLDVPAEVEFTQAQGAGAVSITGPRDVVDDVKLQNGRLSLHHHGHGMRRLRMTISAPAVTRFEVNGDDRLTIRGYRQDRIDLRVQGSSEVTVEGEARAVMLDIAGSGEADLGAVRAEEATVDISGSGEATLAPKSAATLEISGSGEVTLLTRPARLQTEISGSGRVVQEGVEIGADTAANTF